VTSDTLIVRLVGKLVSDLIECICNQSASIADFEIIRIFMARCAVSISRLVSISVVIVNGKVRRGVLHRGFVGE
jgi:hypothetical protein